MVILFVKRINADESAMTQRERRYSQIMQDPQRIAEFVQACRELPRGKNTGENNTSRQRLLDFIGIAEAKMER